MRNNLQNEWTEEDWQNLKLSDDFLFGYVMRDTEMARIFLESLLDIEIESVSHVKTQDAVDLAPQFRGVRLDVRLKADGRLINVEMQNSKSEDLPRRIRYYQALGDSQLLLRGMSYSSLPEFLTIFVCTFDPFKSKGSKDGEGLPLYTIQHVISECPQQSYDDGRKIMIFNTAAWKKSLAQNRKDMLKYIQDGGIDFKSLKVCDFANKVANAKSENFFRRNYMLLSLKLQEMKWDAIREGQELGIQQGMQQGIQQGIAQGRAEARAEAQARIAELEAELARYKASQNAPES